MLTIVVDIVKVLALIAAAIVLWLGHADWWAIVAALVIFGVGWWWAFTISYRWKIPENIQIGVRNRPK